MNLEEYEKSYFKIYESFAATVVFILQNALESTPDVPPAQALQSRAKSPGRLRARLEEVGKLESQTLEQDRKDLAGARLIFYTNNDIDKFLRSHIIFNNFEVEKDEVKVHTPTDENEGALYRAIHYIVRLTDDRLKLPEYSKFSGLRCEIQIQTILNHAWSETSHDIVYKDDNRGGFGTRAKKAIETRFRRIMDKYLLPAGHEIQKAQLEYDRLRQGRALFDQDIAKLLSEANENNTRYEIVSGLRDYAIPNYDDLPIAYKSLQRPLLDAVKASRLSKTVEIQTAFGILPGKGSADVTRVVVEIISDLRYVDSIGSLAGLIEIYRDETDEKVRKQILEAAKWLAEYKIPVWKRVGPKLQADLLDYLDTLTLQENLGILSLSIIVYEQALKADVTGTDEQVDSVVFQSGSLPATDALIRVRARAINALFQLFKATNNDDERRRIASALHASARVPSQSGYSNELLKLTLTNAREIVDFLASNIDGLSYELLQSQEHWCLWQYRVAKDLADAADDRFKCKDEAAALVASIIAFRDKAGKDERYVRYNILVGFEAVYPGHWTDKKYDYVEAGAYRKEQIGKFVDGISNDNEDYWFELLERCAATKSNDGATFQALGDFIVLLAKSRPQIADRYLFKASPDLLSFLPGFLNGLAASGDDDIYHKHLENELSIGARLPGLAKHLRNAPLIQPDFAGKVLNRAIKEDDRIAIFESVALLVEQFGNGTIADERALFRKAIAFLTKCTDARWVLAVWYLPKIEVFLDALDVSDVELVLTNLKHLSEIDYHSERVLGRIAERHLEAIWDYFGDRIATEKAGTAQKSFEALPFSFHGLEKSLSTNPALAIAKGRTWYAGDNNLFQYRAGSLLSKAFPTCTPDFAQALADLVDREDESAADFALEILKNYDGQPTTHIALKRIVARYSNDPKKMARVKISIDNTGVVGGEYGFAEAYRQKKVLLEEWLTDKNMAIQNFAKQHIRELDIDIATEHRRAEERIALRKLDFSVGTEDGDGGGKEEDKG